ncbi:hypothetical protein [Candidatus Uabimicrobium sp. HlEnr_7]|uniref:hypothetical protein n=1 Tax=Candidatus Uabimicrobium helgolandensis TaxID=3095367 RepID=UPI003556E13F
MNAIKHIQPQNLISQRIQTRNLTNRVLEKYCLRTMHADFFPLVFQEYTEATDDNKEEHNTTDIHNINFYLKHFERILQTNLHLFHKTNQTNKLNKSFQNNAKEHSFKQLKNQLQNTLSYRLPHSSFLEKTGTLRDNSVIQDLMQKAQQQVLVQKILTNITTRLKNVENIQQYTAEALSKEKYINVHGILDEPLYKTVELSNSVKQNLNAQNARLTEMISRYSNVDKPYTSEYMKQNDLGFYHDSDKKILSKFGDLKQVTYMFKHFNAEKIIQKFNDTSNQKNLRILDNLTYKVSSPMFESGEAKNAYSEKLLRHFAHLTNVSSLSNVHTQSNVRANRFDQKFNLPQVVHQQQKNTSSLAKTVNNFVEPVEDHTKSFEPINNTRVQKIISKYTDLFYSSVNAPSSLQRNYIQNLTTPYNLVYEESHHVDASPQQDKTVKMLQVLKNLERKFSIGTQDKTISTQENKVVETLQALNNLVHENLYSTENNKTISKQENKITEMLQVLNNLVHQNPRSVENNKTISKQENKTAEMLQVLTNLVHQSPRSVKGKVLSVGNNKTIFGGKNKTVEMLQVLNNLVHQNPHSVENKTIISKQENKTAEMLQVLNNLAHQNPSFIENKAISVENNKTIFGGKNKTVEMFQVLNNLAHQNPRFIENKAISVENNKTIFGGKNKTVEMFQILNNLVHQNPRFIENKAISVENNKTIFGGKNKTVEMFQVLNNLVHQNPRFVENKAISVENNKIIFGGKNKTAEMLQVLNNLVHQNPRSVENKTMISKQENKTVEMLQILNSLARENPHSVENKTIISKQENKTVEMFQILNNLVRKNPRSAENKTIFGQENKTVEMLQVLSNLVHQDSHSVENSEAALNKQGKITKVLQTLNNLKIKVVSNTQDKTNVSIGKNTRTSEILQKLLKGDVYKSNKTLLSNFQYIKNIGVESSHLAIPQSKIQQMLPVINQLIKSYSTNKNIANYFLNTQQPVNELTYKVLTTDNDVGKIQNSNSREKAFEKLMVKSSWNTVDGINSGEKKLNSKMLQRVANLQNQVCNKFSLLYDQYFFTEQNPLSHRVYTNRIQHLDNNYQQFSKKHLQYSKKPTQKHVAIHREVLPLKYKEIQKQQAAVEEKQKHKKQKTTHIHITDNKIQNIAARVYKMLEKKMAIEKNRRGIF